MISIIIVNYRVKKELFDCISSIFNSNQSKDFEIIVIDNSEINEIEIELKKKFSKVIYIKSEVNLGYGKGNNLGAKFAKGEYLFFLNPDTKIVSGKISSLSKFIKNNKKIGAVAPQLLNSKNETYDEQGAMELTPIKAFIILSFINKLFKKNRIWKKYWKVPWNKNELKNVDIVPGTAFLIKKELFIKIGGFDPKFFLYFEEFDFCRKLINDGYKNYIIPDLKLSHKWGASTSKNTLSTKYFVQSRYYYFRKNYGISKALLVEFFLRINKELIFLLATIFLALILRLFDLENRISFIGDMAWFFVSAKNFITQGQIPFVGITSSHVWLHQGAFWTYILSFLLIITKYNPIPIAYFTVLLDLTTLILLYLFCKKYFNLRTAIFASLFYATSPFLILSSQNPYHTNPIPILTLILIYCVLKWIKGKAIFFPIIILLLTVLYNFQISILPLGFCVVALILYGIVKKTNWIKSLLNKKIILISLLAFFIPMIPMLIHDLTHGFPQTLKVGLWLIYRVALLFGYPPVNAELKGDSWNSIVKFILEYNSWMLYLQNKAIALLLFFITFIFIVFKAKKHKFKLIEENIIILFLIIPISSYIATKTNSAAYLPMMFPQFAIMIGYFFGNINKKYFIFATVIFAFIITSNIYMSLITDRGGGIKDKIIASEKIIKLSKNEQYNIVILGENGKFQSSNESYNYLTWYLGKGPVDQNVKTKIYVTEMNKKIIINR